MLSQSVSREMEVHATCSLRGQKGTRLRSRWSEFEYLYFRTRTRRWVEALLYRGNGPRYPLVIWCVLNLSLTASSTGKGDQHLVVVETRQCSTSPRFYHRRRICAKLSLCMEGERQLTNAYVDFPSRWWWNMFNGRHSCLLRCPLLHIDNIDDDQFSGIASGLSYLHSINIVHGDLKTVR